MTRWIVGIALCLASCKGKTDSETKDTTADTDKPAATTVGDSDSDADDMTLQQVCHDYQSILAKLARCDAFPAASRQALQQRFDNMTKAWATKTDASSKKAIIQMCKTGVAQVTSVAGKTCDW